MPIMLRKKRDGSGPNNGWIVSYGDLVTTLLCFFIILTALAEDQTGLKLHAGLESFRETRRSFGAYGFLPASNQVVTMSTFKQQYATAEGDPSDSKGANEPSEGLEQRIMDAEEEQLQKYLGEMNRTFKVEKLPAITGQATLDFYVRLNPESPYLTPRHREPMPQIVSLLRRSDYRLFIVVWATTPSNTAWVRAGEQARAIAEELAASYQLDGAARSRLVPVGQPWKHSNFQRPVMSLIIARTVPPS